MTLRLNGSTSGYTEIDAPAVAGNNTITLPTGAGSAYQVVRNGATAGSLEFADKLVLGTAQNSTSGTSIDFTGLPSWVKRITVMFDKVSTSGTSAKLVQLGDSGGIETTEYAGGSQLVQQAAGFSGVYSTAGIPINSGSASDAVSGSLVFTLLSAATNTWAAQGVFRNSSIQTCYCAGSKNLSATLTQLRITTVNGTDTFDAGSINILYEG